MPSRALLSCWLLTLACGGPPSDEPALRVDLTGLDPELVRGVEQAQARVQAAPRDPQAWFGLAAVLDANELDLGAEQAWSRVVELAPGNARAWYHLARVRELRGETSGALEALAPVQELEPDYPPAVLRRGRLLLDSGRIDEAEPVLRRALELDPGAPGPTLALARLELLRDQPAAAIARLEPLRQRLPYEPYVNSLLARAHAVQGEVEQADACLQAEQHAGAPSVRDPWQAEIQAHALGMKVRIERARTRLAAGDAEGAWQELAPLEDRADELVVLDVQCQVLLALGRPDEVLARLDRADPRFAQSSLLVVNRVLALRARGETERALDTMTAEVRRNPAPPAHHVLEGELLFELGRYEEAIAAYEEGRARGDRTLSCALQLARARTSIGDLQGGLRDLEAAAREFPFAPKPWAYRSEVLALEGRDGEARDSLAEAERRGLEPELVARVRARLEELEAERR